MSQKRWGIMHRWWGHNKSGIIHVVMADTAEEAVWKWLKQRARDGFLAPSEPFKDTLAWMLEDDLVFELVKPERRESCEPGSSSTPN